MKLRGGKMDYKVLIAEDDRDIVEVLTLYLNSDGFSVFTAENGEDALKIAKTQKFPAFYFEKRLCFGFYCNLRIFVVK